MLAVFFLSVATAAAALALPLDRLRFADVGSEFNARVNDLMIAAGFGIDQVNVSGQRFAADSDIFDALDLPNVRTFAAFDSDAALKRIERIPWVDNAQITRVYPSTLDIVIRERVPAAIWTRGDKNYLIDATGRVLGPLPVAGGWALPRVVGEGANGEATLLLAALQQYPALERDYAYAERIAERRWRIVLKNGSAIELGADREIEGLEEIADTRPLRSVLSGKAMIVDVRTPGRITVRPAGPSARTAALATTLASGQP
jgi:cell division protein FtsQ